MREVPKGDAGAEQRSVQILAAGHPDAPLVQKGTGATRSGEQLFMQGIVNNPALQLPAVSQSDRHGKLRETVQVVRRAVQRIDDPLVFVALECAAFLGEDRVVRLGLADRRDDGCLGGAVHFTDEVVAALFGHAECLGAVEGTQQDAAGVACCTDGDIGHGLHGAREYPKGRQSESAAVY